MNKHFFTHRQALQLENGKQLPRLEIVYHTLGKLNEQKNNVVWICHALTANSDVADWWDSLVGPGKCIDPADKFIVCANILGSCYGSSGPLSINPDTEKPYYSSFPQVTIRDMVNAHIILRKHLGIDKIQLLIGGSMGGYQAMEWAITEKSVIQNLVLVATSPQESAWGIAIHTAQRLAIETDNSWKELAPQAGAAGLKTARAIGMLTYRNYEAFVNTQHDAEHKLDDFKASSYINYQGEKLVKRFNAYSYWLLTKAMDSHNIARGRGTIDNVLASLTLPTLVIGIRSDFLCPLAEQQFMAAKLPTAKLIELNSPYGHDGFLIEGDAIGTAIRTYFASCF